MAPAPSLSVETTDDAFLGGRLVLLQPLDGYRSGLDAVLLAASVPAKPGRGVSVLDAGSGVGAVGLGVAALVPDAHVTLVEIDPLLAALARENIARNGLGGRAALVETDIARGGAALHDPARPSGLDPGRFDHVLANPPYYVEGTGTRPEESRRAVAHQMSAESLDRWIAFLATAAATGATLSVIHRAEALGAILRCLEPRFGRIRILPVQARRMRPAKRVLIEAVKGSRAPLALLPALVLQDDAGQYLPKVDAILRGKAMLRLAEAGPEALPLPA